MARVARSAACARRRRSATPTSARCASASPSSRPQLAAQRAPGGALTPAATRPTHDADSPPLPNRRVRRRVDVRGIVQGVGFRPFVYRLARELALDGLGAQRRAGRHDRGRRATSDRDRPHGAPAARRSAARSRASTRRRRRLARRCATGTGFAILESGGGRAATAIGPDSAICADCLAELFDPRDRRYRYAFINCTHCGPRYTITRELALRPRDDEHGGVRAVPALPRRIHVARATAASTPSRTRARRAGRGSRCSTRAARPMRDGDPIAATLARLRARRDRRDQGAGRLPSRLRRAQRRRGRAPARAQGARGKAVRRDGRERRVGRGACADVAPASARCSNRASARSCCCARRARRRCRACRRRAGTRVARRDAAVHAAAVPAVPRGGGPARRHRLARRAAASSCW